MPIESKPRTRPGRPVVPDAPGGEWYSGPARSRADVDAARRLHTRRYAETGYIQARADAPFDDGWMAQRHWVVVARGPAVAGCASLISPTATLPTLTAFGIDAATDARLAECWRRHRLVEVSALCRDERFGPTEVIRGLLYRALWQQHRQRGDHDQWLASMSWRRFDALRRTPWPLEVLGRTEEYYGNSSVACVIDLRLARLAFELRDRHLLAWLDSKHDDPSALINPRV
jgi:hypothetical protein